MIGDATISEKGDGTFMVLWNEEAESGEWNLYGRDFETREEAGAFVRSMGREVRTEEDDSGGEAETEEDLGVDRLAGMREATAAAPTSQLPLSAAAEEVLAALQASVESGSGSPSDPLGWLSAVLDDYPEALTDPEGDTDLDAVQAAVHATRDGVGQSRSLTKAEIVRQAGQRAQSQRRPLVSSQDIIQVVLALVVQRLQNDAEPNEPTPAAMEPERPERGELPGQLNPEPDPLPASMAAEEMLEDLSGRLGIEDEESVSIFRWLDTLLACYPVEVGGGEGTRKLQMLKDWGNGLLASGSPTPAYSAQQIHSLSAGNARGDDRPLFTPQDVAIAIVQAAAAVRAVAEAEPAGEDDLDVRPEEAEGPPIEEVPEQASEPESEPEEPEAPEDPEDTMEIEFPEFELEMGPDLPGIDDAQGVTAAPSEGEPTDPGRTRTFRLFVSSTFQDLQAERNALQEITFRRLEKFCARRGARFQAIDLRWGVSEEAGVDQQTMNICLGEIERCRRVTPRPNFLILLGDRYGWRPPPPQIPAQEFEEILDQVKVLEERKRLTRWYRKDLNASPPEYRLRPRSGEYRDWKAWEPVEAGLRNTLGRAVGIDGLNLLAGRRKVFQASATEQEVLAGALEVPEPEEKVFCILRRIEGYPKDKGENPLEPPKPEEKGRDERWPDFFVSPDKADRNSLQRLKLNIADQLPPSNRLSRKVPWTDKGLELTEEYLTEVTDWVEESLKQAILRELENPTEGTEPEAQIPEALEADPILATEVGAHLEFAEERRRFFVGREDILQEITDHAFSDSEASLALVGGGGTGKSAIMAEAARRIERTASGEVLVVRFVGATPGSSDSRSLLENLCREIAMAYGSEPGDMPSEYQELVPKFAELLNLASSARPLILLVDSLDQLTEPALGLTWIPFSLPPNVRLVVSTRPDEVRERVEHRGTKLLEVQERLEHRGSRFLEVGPLSRDDGELLLGSWLSSALPPRRLQPIQRDAVLNAFAAAKGNPLYLKLAAEEARRWPAWADHGGEVPEDLPTPQLAKGVNGIIREDLFKRLADNDNHGSELVSHAVGYIAASRYGLAEDELFRLLSRDPDVYTWFLHGAQHMPPDLVKRAAEHWTEAVGKGDQKASTPESPTVTRLRELCKDAGRLRTFLTEDVGLEGLQLPVVLWSRLFFDLEPYLTERQVEGGNLLSFYHRELDDVAAEKFLTDGRKEDLHGRLADFFRSRADPEGEGTWDGEGVRGLSELPYHLTHAGRSDEVYEVLTDFAFLEQKAARVGIVKRTGPSGKEDTLYTGVFQLQDDFDRALKGGSGGEEARTGAHPLIVTAVDFGKGLVVRCPWCNTEHPLDRDWLGNTIKCPNKECEGPLKLNTFTVGDGPST